MRPPEFDPEPFTSFSERIRAHHAIAVKSSHGDAQDILAVTDQILVCFQPPNEKPLKDVENWLIGKGVFPQPLTTVFFDLLRPGQRDAMIYKLIFPRSTFPDIFAVVHALRAHFSHLPPGSITPNHVLVPATYENHSCPSGPPIPPSGPGVLPPPGLPPRKVTVIDSGYQWSWNTPNPLGPNQSYSVADRLYAGDWIADLPDVTSVFGGNRLDALAGHANFITGVIRQRCPQAKVTIRNHNGGFAPDADDIPTEAAVARSLFQSTDAEVIDLGFAFVAFKNQISCIWDTALKQIGSRIPVVAPAGNSKATVRRYPAALARASIFHPAYPNVIGVASSVSGVISSFSNRGAVGSVNDPWVTCSANGENVFSTFLAVTGVPEDLVVTNNVQPTLPWVFPGWAIWNGTSFAAPKVVAKIANVIAQSGGDGLAAWQNITTMAGVNSSPALGYILDTLP